jgi:hypothetical protein
MNNLYSIPFIYLQYICNMKTGRIYWANFQTRFGPSSGTANTERIDQFNWFKVRPHIHLSLNKHGRPKRTQVHVYLDCHLSYVSSKCSWRYYKCSWQSQAAWASSINIRKITPNFRVRPPFVSITIRRGFPCGRPPVCINVNFNFGRRLF